MKESSCDIAIVGAGPIGIEMAAELKKRGFDYRHIEAGCIGATINWWPIETVFFSSSDRISICDLPLDNSRQLKTTKEEYLTYLRSVVKHFDLKIETFRRLTRISRLQSGSFSLGISPSSNGVGGPDELKTNISSLREDESLTANKVIFAIGDIHRPRQLGITGEELPHVSHFLENPHKFYGKKVLIVGGKNSAVEAAIRLQRVGAEVTLSYRRDGFDVKCVKPWLLPDIRSAIRRKLITFIASSEVVSIDNNFCNLVAGGSTIKVDADFVLLLTGFMQDSSLFKQAGIRLSGEGNCPEYNFETMESNQKGLFLAGTASAGTQIGGVTEFIETSHIHVDKIIAHLSGLPAPKELPSELSDRES